MDPIFLSVITGLAFGSVLIGAFAWISNRLIRWLSIDTTPPADFDLMMRVRRWTIVGMVAVLLMGTYLNYSGSVLRYRADPVYQESTMDRGEPQVRIVRPEILAPSSTTYEQDTATKNADARREFLNNVPSLTKE